MLFAIYTPHTPHPPRKEHKSSITASTILKRNRWSQAEIKLDEASISFNASKEALHLALLYSNSFWYFTFLILLGKQKGFSLLSQIWRTRNSLLPLTISTSCSHTFPWSMVMLLTEAKELNFLGAEKEGKECINVRISWDCQMLVHPL